MKKYFLFKTILLLFIMSFLLFACKKVADDAGTDDSKPKYNVSIGIRKLNESGSISEDSLKKLFSAITCYIVQKDNVANPYTRRIIQKYYDSNTFGTFNDSLPSGSFTAYFTAVGKEANLTPHRFTTTGQPGIFDSLPILLFSFQASLDGWLISNSDCFIGDSINFTVQNGDNQSLQVDMKRIVGLLKLNITDDYPNSNLRVSIRPRLIAGYYNPATDNYDTLSNERKSDILYFSTNELQKISEGNYQMFMPYVDNPFSILIEQLTSDSHVIKSKQINKQKILDS